MAIDNKQDIIVKGRDNPVVIDFTFQVEGFPNFGLISFTDMEVIFGTETYTLLLDPTIVVVNSNTQLQLNLGDTAEEFPSYLVITGFNVDYPDGYVLTSKCLANLTIPRMC